MFNRRITKKDYPDLLNEMGNDLEHTQVMVTRMQDWVTDTGLDQDLAQALGSAAAAVKDAHDAAHHAWRRVSDEIEKEGRDR
ncbi:hypothetical protein ACFQHV_11540 [Promicromonospora thailandica]|uniref:Uncharacterized protein n=1 Tax=Promicromonospora thailandica TaxID=765201 RepID=A0A9X2G1B7_9MICO|nr:hypothetical protein [Promicromonospora thailandica]MCP2265019.1 hypothetical protein [Promicromonospora thailandica]BFF19930.1 hypothetical protein GCM10025730_34510 [Promicromonospora thailandica]